MGIVLVDGITYYLAHAQLPTVGWALGVTIPIDEVVLPAQNLLSSIEQHAITSKEDFDSTLSSTLKKFMGIFIFSTLVISSFALIFSRTITNPINQLVKSTKRIGDGDLNSRIEVQTQDEIGQLAETFNAMTDSLKEYINNLSQAIAEREHMQAELNVASKIQNNMLPRIFPVFSELENIKTFAKMTSAKEVGGDFYDFFFVDEHKKRLCCLIADVSGKGVPASLFMVIAKTILKSSICSHSDLLKAITYSNETLAADNNSFMFVTAFISILNLETGELEYVNCGHNPPLLYRNGKSFEFLKLDNSIAMAALEEANYKKEKLTLEKGDILYLYTDGITEAMRVPKDIYSEKSLLKVLNSIKNRQSINPKFIDEFVREDVGNFVGDTEQSDDMTTFIIQYTKE